MFHSTGYTKSTRDCGSSRRSECLFLVILLVFFWSVPVLSIEWLVLANDHQHWNRTSDCSRVEKGAFYKDQKMICKRNIELMPLIRRAARDTVDTCQELFADRRWNCSSVLLAPSLMNDLSGGSREQAYVYSLAAAALTRTIAKACSLGATTKCSCGPLPNEPPPPGDFKWGGCGDDVRFGTVFSKWFTDTPLSRRKSSKKSIMNLHNNAAGRKVASESLSPTCKCHGVSGSCTIKTCWKALPDIRALGRILQKRYAVALEVDTKRSAKTKQRVVVSAINNRKTTEEELIYYTISPDFCLPDKSLGSVGTAGRECLRDHPGSGGCRSMCCGRGYVIETIDVQHRCDCKYYWCCYVKCNICVKKVEVYRCR